MDIRRQVSPLVRMFLRVPYSFMTMVVRIKGEVTGDVVRGAVYKVQKRHPNLWSWIVDDQDNIAWFTTQDVEEISIEVVCKAGDDSWKTIFHGLSTQLLI